MMQYAVSYETRLMRDETLNFSCKKMSYMYPAGKTADDGGVLTFTRSGLTWKLTRAWSPRQTNGRGR